MARTAGRLDERVAPADGRASAIAPAARPAWLPEWWREETIVRLVAALYRHVRQHADPYALLTAPLAIGRDHDAGICAAYPDICIVPPDATLDGRRSAITSLRLAIDVLPAATLARTPVTAASRLPGVAIEEHWLVDPFAHRVTVTRAQERSTRHHRREIVWRITPYARPVSVFVRPLFMAPLAWPIVLEPAPSPGLADAAAEILG
jgi:hypothetical protein